MIVDDFCTQLSSMHFCSNIIINVIECYETWRIPDDDEHLSEDEPLVNLRSKHAHKRYKDANRQGNG